MAAQGTVLCEPEDEIDQIYFPLSGMISLVMVMKDGKAIETATVGREGVVGAMAGFLAEMLGVRRTSVTEVAAKIQAAGSISYSRGVIKIVDLSALKAMSCECYETLREESG